MGKTRAQQDRANELRRIEKSKGRQSNFIAEYVQLKYFHLYAEAAGFYNALNTMYPNKYDLRKTYEYREWKMAINGEILKTKRKPPQYENIQNTTQPQRPETEPQSPQRPETEPRSPQRPETEPRSPQRPETEPRSPQRPETEPQSPQRPETEPRSPQSPETEPRSPQSPETEPPSPQSPETEPPSPQSPETEPPVYNDGMELKIPLL